LLDTRSAQAILMIAPPGYGKTSLACEWLEGRDSVAWYRATSASADVAAFSVGVAEVVAPLVPGAGSRLRQRLRVAEPPEKAARPLAELLAEDLAGWPEDAWLVVDDYHLVIDSAPVEEFVDWLLMLSPIRLLVTTRRRPGWASARRTLYGEVAEITKDQLAMTNDEASQVLAGRTGDAIRTLVAQAQGWPALIGLAALSETAEVPDERVLDGLFRYFAEEVFRQEPPQVQHFMLVASIPQTINLEIVRDVLEVENAAEMLARLHEEGLLQESGTDEYAFHPLLREFLRRRINHEQSELARPLTARVASFAKSAARWDEAFDLIHSDGTPEELATLTAAAAHDLIAAGRVETLEKWLTAAGPAASRNSKALLARTEVLLRQRRFLEAASLGRELGERLANGSDDESRAWYLSGQACHLSNDPRAIERHRMALATALTPRDRGNALWGIFSAGSELDMDVDDTIDQLRAHAVDDDETRLQLTAAEMIAAVKRGPLAQVAADMNALIPVAEQELDPSIRSNFLGQLAYTNAMLARYGKGHELALWAEELCTEYRLGFAIPLCRFVRATCEIGLKDLGSARATIARLTEDALTTDDQYLQAALAILRIKLAFADGHLERLHTSVLDFLGGPAPRGIRGEVVSLCALVAVATGDSAKAQRYSADARRLTTEICARAYCDVSEAIATLTAGDGLETSELLRIASRIRALGIYDVLVTSYRAYPPLLSIASLDPEARWDLANIARLANDQSVAARAGLIQSDVGERSDGKSLTKRELEVLELVRGGLSNAEIAKRLVISESTVKVHVHHILAKLGTKTRLQAALLDRKNQGDGDS
jgi:ATP/maltotriose-dependent transcriptional regulator MalT